MKAVIDGIETNSVKQYSNQLGDNSDQQAKGTGMGLLSDTQNCGLRMRRECRERLPARDFKGNR